MFEIKIESDALTLALKQLQEAGQNMAPVMRAIKTELLGQVETNFEAEGRPKWDDLSDVTKRLRGKKGKWPGKIMQVSGQLAASYTGQSDNNSVVIGSNKKYAAIQQLGGITSSRSMIPNKPIKARPVLPIDAQGKLQPQTEAAIMQILDTHFRNIKI